VFSGNIGTIQSVKILVATSDVPFVEGGHRVIANGLVAALREAGHDAEIFTTPQNRFGRQFSAYVATRFTDVELTGTGEKIDRLISIRFPSYVLKHPNHVSWLNHRMREYYDLWPEWTSRLSWKGRKKESIRRFLIQKADNYFLKKNVRKIFAQSANIQKGLREWGNIPSEVLYPPPPLRNYRTDRYEDFILCPSRLTPLKRIPLLIEALSHTKSGNAVILGDGAERQNIESLIKARALEQRVKLAGYVTEQEMLDLYARCRAVFYAPVNEDFGLVTMEAFRSRKPVLTATDSGGPTELVRNAENGFVLPPDPAAFGEKIAMLMDYPSLAQDMGRAAYDSCSTITWPETIRKLLE
jgi:glycosyltransferase involved in cell wall biosynthesis